MNRKEVWRIRGQNIWYHGLPVCQVGGHDEVVLHNEAGLLGVQDEPLDHLSGHQPLLRVQVGTEVETYINVFLWQKDCSF